MIPRLKPTLDGRELYAAFTLPRQDDVERFETAFAEKMEQKHGIAFPYGRTALYFLLKALKLEGREIICPAYTCVVVPHAIVMSGNHPIFVDCQEQDFNMNLDLVLQSITEKTGAIIATSIFGYPVNLDQLDSLRKKYSHIYIIQDCAHSFAAHWKGRPVQKEGVAAFYGLNISKIITSIFGGMITTDNDKLAAELRHLRKEHLRPPTLGKSIRRLLYLLAVYPTFLTPFYTLVNRLERWGWLATFVDYYEEETIDMPDDFLEMMRPIEARVGEVQLEKYDQIIAHRRNLAKLYSDHLKDLPALEPPPLIEGATYSHYVPKVNNRKKILERALQSGLQLGWLIEYSIPQMAAYRQRYPDQPDCPFANRFSRETINLPLHINPSQFSRVYSKLKKVIFNEKAALNKQRII